MHKFDETLPEFLEAQKQGEKNRYLLKLRFLRMRGQNGSSMGTGFIQ